MGGHGGLNILPQKRWNVYNFDNRERVRRDEEAAACEESIRQQQARERDAEFRLEKLREAARARRDGQTQPRACGNANCTVEAGDAHAAQSRIISCETQTESSQHTNLFEGLDFFGRDPQGSPLFKETSWSLDEKKSYQDMSRRDKQQGEGVQRRRQETKGGTKAGQNGVEAENEHYRLGYGCLSKDAKRPWYLTKSSLTDEHTDSLDDAGGRGSPYITGKKSEKRVKTMDALREERMKREQQEKEKARKLLFSKSGGPSQKTGTDSKHRPYYNSSFGNAR